MKRYKIIGLCAYDGEEAYSVLKENSDVKIVLTRLLNAKNGWFRINKKKLEGIIQRWTFNYCHIKWYK